MNHINFYSDNSNELSELYNSVSSKKVHESWIEQLPTNGKVLDIGSGNGRDCKYMHQRGLDVTGIEPSKLLNFAKSSYPDIKWINDTLPHLDSQYYPHSEHPKYQYDLILCSAVWMHIEPKHRIASLDNMLGLLSNIGIIVITLRYGDFDDEREGYPIDRSHLEDYCITMGLEFEIIKNDDCLGRDVWWETIIIKQHERLRDEQ